MSPLSNTEERKGMFFAIEGTDGSGKGTQFELLKKRLTEQGYDVASFDFPRYDEPSSFFVREYLNGEYGGPNDVGPYTGSLFYALDRYQAAVDIKAALDAGKVVLANRFTGSNMAHQGTKFDHPEERRGYFIWLDNLEYQMLGIPRPDRSIVLRVPADTAQKLVDGKEDRSYTDKKRDIHEADINHLRRSVEVYDDLCQLFPQDFMRIDCVRNDELMSIEAVHDHLWKTIEPLLPSQAETTAGTVVPHKPAELPNPYVRKTDSGYHITSAGREWLRAAVSNVTGSVYATYPRLESLTAAAAMARLSRRGDDMRVTILDEFAQAIDDNENLRKDMKLLQRVITAYGDDSVQQLVGQHMVVENASNLLTKKLEWGRLASYLEQSTRYIFYDQKDKNGKYKYYVPDYFNEVVKEDYTRTMDRIFDLYSGVVHKLTDYVRAGSTIPESERDVAWKGATRAQACDAARAMLPVATTSTVGIFASGQAIESLIMRLQADELPEAQHVGEQLLTEARKVIGTFLERADKPDRGGATIAYLNQTKASVAKLAQSYIKETYGDNSHQPVTLRSYSPRNELDAVPFMLYEHTSMPLEQIQSDVDVWPIARKTEVFQAYMGERLNRRHRPGRAMEHAHYTWDLVCDYGIFRDLQRHRMVDDLQWQQLSPRMGYEVPQLVEDAGLTDDFQACFDLSMQLYSKLQSAGYTNEAQYATLFGHRMRTTITYNARQAFHMHELRTSPQGHPGYRKLVQEMHDQLAAVHPLTAEAMRFVNQDEDAELTRLAAERYTQFKLNQLDP
jgi:thymidylate kinase/thymidylate synthase ThyX